MKNKKILYLICALFTIASIFLFVTSKEVKTTLVSIVLFLVCGVGGISTFILDKKENKDIAQEKNITITDKRGKMIALMFACLCFVIASYFTLPFNHLFDDNRSYTPTMGYIVGIVGMLFFGFGFISSIIRLIKPMLIMEILDEGLVVSKGFKNQVFIAWEDIKGIARNDTYLFIYLKNPNLYPVNKVVNFLNTKMTGTNIYIPINSINYNIEQVVNIIRDKLILHEKQRNNEI